MNRRQRRRRRLLLRLALLTPPALALGLWAAGLPIAPVHREATRRHYPASPEAVWSALTDLDGMPNWRSDIAAIERLPIADGTLRWLEVGVKGRRRVFERAESVPPNLLVVRQGSREGSRRWIFRIQRELEGSALDVTEERPVQNPIVRSLVKVFGSDRSRIESLADDLGNRLAGHRQRVAVVDRP